MTISQDIVQMIRKMRNQGLAMIHNHHNRVVDNGGSCKKFSVTPYKKAGP